MPEIKATLDYLQKLQLYETVKPYWCLLPPSKGYDPNIDRVDNLEFEEHTNIPIRDLRECEDPVPRIDDCGFQFLNHRSAFGSFTKAEEVAMYRTETEELLKTMMNAIYVKCYDSVLRKNVVFERDKVDLADPLHTEGPARGVHNDITFESGLQVIHRYMSEDDKARFLKPEHRLRIINTWRTLIPVLEDRPLAFCDSRSVDPGDLVATDRVIPGNIGEVYYLTHNSKHQWYWLEKQTPEEPLILVMYDTKAGSHARFCPHVSFENPRCPGGAAPRESVETRSIVITMDG